MIKFLESSHILIYILIIYQGLYRFIVLSSARKVTEAFDNGSNIVILLFY